VFICIAFILNPLVVFIINQFIFEIQISYIVIRPYIFTRRIELGYHFLLRELFIDALVKKARSASSRVTVIHPNMLSSCVSASPELFAGVIYSRNHSFVLVCIHHGSGG